MVLGTSLKTMGNKNSVGQEKALKKLEKQKQSKAIRRKRNKDLKLKEKKDQRQRQDQVLSSGSVMNTNVSQMQSHLTPGGRAAHQAQLQQIVQQNKLNNQTQDNNAIEANKNGTIHEQAKDLQVQIEYQNANEMEIIAQSKQFAEFKQVFENFDAQIEALKGKQERGNDKLLVDEPETKDHFSLDQNQGTNKDDSTKNGQTKEAAEKQLTKKQKKLQQRMSIFDLKFEVKRPDLVEAWDVTAQDPIFLLEIKQVRNSVPVPRHWSQKRRYLQYKRGIHKIPFKLPDFIEQTGITKLREQSTDKSKTLKQKMRERMQPKMGQIDIDYEVLHDAFFKQQKKPKLTTHGDLYFEGKEYEIRMRDYKPGRFSPALRAALGIQENSPPTWLYNMQRYGPPPAYPNLKIPGVNNIPMPDAQGNSAFGKFFTDEKGYTVYADCHGLNKAVYQKRQNRAPYWGQVKEIDYDAMEDSYQSGEGESGPDSDSVDFANIDEGLNQNLSQGGLSDSEMDLQQHQQKEETFKDIYSGIQSLIHGSQTPADIQISKKELVNTAENEPAAPSLYKVLEEVAPSDANKSAIFASDRTYKMPGSEDQQVNIQKQTIESGQQQTNNIAKEADATDVSVTQASVQPKVEGDKTTAEKSKQQDKKKKDKYKVKF